MALQATDNSIPFYESLGFVRVGAVMKDGTIEKRDRAKCKVVDGNLKEVPENYEVVTSKTYTYTIQKGGYSISDAAKKCHVDPWDIIFLNQHLGTNLLPGTRLYKGTQLNVPFAEAENKSQIAKTCSNGISPKWHIARENETPRSIAKIYGVQCTDVVNANRRRHPELLSSSRLKEGTRVQVSHFDIESNDYKPYSHWSFPDDEFEDGEPSYMMVRKLNRRKGKAVKVRPFRQLLAASFSSYEKPSLLRAAGELPLPKNEELREPQLPTIEKEIISKNNPRSAFLHFVDELKELADGDLSSLSIGEVSKLFGDLWKDLPSIIRSMYEKIAIEEAEVSASCPNMLSTSERNCNSGQALVPKVVNAVSNMNKQSLYNTVVRLKPGAILEHNGYSYW